MDRVAGSQHVTRPSSNHYSSTFVCLTSCVEIIYFVNLSVVK